MNSHDYDDSRVPEFLWLHALRSAASGARRQSGDGQSRWAIQLRSMSRASADEVPGSMLFSLMVLRMLKCDEHGNPMLTDLAEAALERMRGRIH